MTRTPPLSWIIAAIVLPLAFAAAEQPPPGQDATDRERTHVETITGSRYGYAVSMGGLFDGDMTRDPIGYAAFNQYFEPNRSVLLENIGNVPVRNPWILVNGKRDWRTVQRIIESALRPGMTDGDKAVALWWQEVNSRFHATTEDDECNDPVKVHNVYGYTLCGNDAINLFGLWSVAGLQVRACRIQGHCITEVFADGRWNLLDGDEHGLYLLRDNRTIASQTDLARDHDLIKRHHTYGVLAGDSRTTDEFSASLFCYEEPGGKYNPSLTHSMELTLRPGEAIEWGWGHEQLKFHGRGSIESGWGPTAAGRVCNGRWRYAVDFTKPGWRYATDQPHGVAADPAGLRATADRGAIVIPMRSPYVFVGGEVTVAGNATLSLSWDGKEWQALVAEGGRIDLDPLFPHDGEPRYQYFLRLEPGQEPVRSLTIENDLQMAQLSLPALELGKNAIAYTDDTTEPHRVRLTHRWIERSSTHPPAAVAGALSPPDGGTVRGTKLQFHWEPATDPDGDAIADYEFLLSDRADMAWPLSSNLHRLVSHTPDRGKAQFGLPYLGLLNSDTTYYWKVRPRDANRVWGPWSKVFTFRTKTPHPPVGLKLETDQNARTVTVHWEPASEGTRPTKYKVYGSSEKGFTVSDVAYEVNVGNQGEANTLKSPFPANLMCETAATSCQVVGAALRAPNVNQAFYRVVAVDGDGLESGPSDYVELPRPFLFTQPVTAIEVRTEWEYPVRTLASLGDLRSRTKDPTSVYNATYWDIERPRYSLVHGPEWMAMEEQTGLLTGRPPVPGKYDVRVAAKIGKKTDTQAFVLEVAFR